MIGSLWLWLVLAAAAPCGSAAACSCAVPHVETKYPEAEAVFRGVVVEVEALRPTPSGSFRRPVTLRVTGRWKGADARTVVVGDHAGCAVNFEVGKEYVVYADRDEHGALVTSMCDRTGLLSAAAGDLPVLDRLARAR